MQNTVLTRFSVGSVSVQEHRLVPRQNLGLKTAIQWSLLFILGVLVKVLTIIKTLPRQMEVTGHLALLFFKFLWLFFEKSLTLKSLAISIDLNSPCGWPSSKIRNNLLLNHKIASDTYCVDKMLQRLKIRAVERSIHGDFSTELLVQQLIFYNLREHYNNALYLE